jgi:hypothetical protein
MWKCPKCGSTNLYVSALVKLKLHQDEDNFETTDEGSDHEWDGSSSMQCGSCNHTGNADQFDVAEDSLLPIGTKLYSSLGVTSDTSEGQDVWSGSAVIGEIVGLFPEQVNCYSAMFPKGVTVFLSKEEVANQFTVIEGDFFDETHPWIVQVNRTGYASRNMTVDARFAKEAEWLALDRCGDLDFSEVGSDYDIDGVRLIKI